MISTVSEDPEHVTSKKLLFCKYMEKIGDFTMLVRNDARIFNISLAQESLSNFSFSYIYKQKAHTHTQNAFPAQIYRQINSLLLRQLNKVCEEQLMNMLRLTRCSSARSTLSAQTPKLKAEDHEPKT